MIVSVNTVVVEVIGNVVVLCLFVLARSVLFVLGSLWLEEQLMLGGSSSSDIFSVVRETGLYVSHGWSPLGSARVGLLCD